MTKFRNEIILYSLIMAAVAEVVSLIVIGPNIMFVLGLLIGTAVAIVGFIILVKTGQMLMDDKKKKPVVLGYVFRIFLYGISFLFCIKLSLPCGFGCGCGFITVHAGILFLYGIVYRFIRKKENPLNDWIAGTKEWNDLSVYDDEEDDW